MIYGKIMKYRRLLSDSNGIFVWDPKLYGLSKCAIFYKGIYSFTANKRKVGKKPNCF